MAAGGIVVLGRSGQLARALDEEARDRDRALECLGRDRLDLETGADIEAALAPLRPTILVNAAAYTAVDGAESEPDKARALNETAAGHAAEAAARLGIPFIHISTDYVFDGDKPAPYVETDPVAPMSVYGETKLAGERAVLAAHPLAVILRTAWVFSPFGKNFVKTMLRLAAERDGLTVVDDQHGCPTPAHDLAAATLDIADRLTGSEKDRPSGIFHACGTGETTWCGFARSIMEISARLGGPTATVSPIATKDYPTPARRPRNSRLDCAALERAFGIRMPDWHVGLETCIARLVSTPDRDISGDNGSMT